MTQIKKDFLRLGFLATMLQSCATGEKSTKKLCAEMGTPEKREGLTQQRKQFMDK